MYQPIGFRDGDNIIIENGMPYYYNNGSRYSDILKNGLSLDYVIGLQDCVPMKDYIVTTNNNADLHILNDKLKEYKDYEYNHNFYEQKENKTTGLTKKGKWLPFKKKKEKKTKNNNKQLGYDYKLLTIEQYLPDVCDDIHHDEYIDFDAYCEYCLCCHNDDYSVC